MKWRIFLLMLAACLVSGVVADVAQECEDYYAAEKYEKAFPACLRAAEQGNPSKIHYGEQSAF